MNYKSNLFLFSLFLVSTSPSLATPKNQMRYPFYIGALVGYGSTTWEGLVADKKNQGSALTLSTPINAEEGGATWGALAGYEFTPHFAIEATYMKYADSTVFFTNDGSLFSFKHGGLNQFTTQTEALSVMGKIMLYIPHTKVRIFSSAGPAGIHRRDLIVNNWHVGPSFGVGVNYNFTERLMGEIASNYTAGFGESQLSPVDTYFPFLYSVTARIAYRF